MDFLRIIPLNGVLREAFNDLVRKRSHVGRTAEVGFTTREWATQNAYTVHVIYTYVRQSPRFSEAAFLNS